MWYFLVLGFLEHEPEVIPAMEENRLPQYLQKYSFFSEPSYKAWFFPSGFFEQEPDVKPDMVENLLPQHLQKKLDMVLIFVKYGDLF